MFKILMIVRITIFIPTFLQDARLLLQMDKDGF